MKKLILTISIIFLLVSVFYTNTLATEIIIGNTPSNNATVNNSVNNNNTNSNTNANRNTSNNTNITNRINTTSKTNSSSYKNTNLPDTGSEDFMFGVVIVAGLVSAVYAYIKIKTYNI